MTREEASFYLANMDRKYMEEGMSEALDMAIKALEQEPEIDMLDKIRTEIAELEEGISSYHNDRPWVFKDEVLQIIDKYKAESEEKE